MVADSFKGLVDARLLRVQPSGVLSRLPCSGLGNVEAGCCIKGV